jgi:hypothetical protein
MVGLEARPAPRPNSRHESQARRRRGVQSYPLSLMRLAAGTVVYVVLFTGGWPGAFRGLRHDVEYVSDLRKMSGLRALVAVDPMPAVQRLVATRPLVYVAAVKRLRSGLITTE